MTINNYNDPVEVAADGAEDLLDTLIDDLRRKIAIRKPATVEALTDKIMDHLDATPLVQDDPQWMPLMASMLAAVATQRLAYREEGLVPTDDQSRVLIAIAEATGRCGGSLSIPKLAVGLEMTTDEVYRHARALTRLGLLEQM